MRVWRVSRAPFADLTGEGARLYGGRWNSPGRAMLYTAENPALAILEVRVHLDLEPDLLPHDYVLIEMELGDVSAAALELAPDDPTAFGDIWLVRAGEPVLKVPSFIAPQSFNYLVNPAHPAAAAIRIVSTQPFAFDRRLWLPLSN
ncbi:RES domain-containing protein [Bosea sp. CRIB-10]|uniref:RES family NAD+ phosphorylase n=1 Tax=Bosea sp. CRIB-10 TaxID=378404 RepID=UPI0008F0B60A|nr:RES family NAD+ phosphorylase [Bosea sp. CRIB-10]SFB95068.1 RES domain-containing protein [Bosea sp. CRIB-10]